MKVTAEVLLEDELLYERAVTDGTAEVNKIPTEHIFVPKYNEIYYVVGRKGTISPRRMSNSSIDMDFVKVGNCFKTKEKAMMEKERVIEMYERILELVKALI